MTPDDKELSGGFLRSLAAYSRSTVGGLGQSRTSHQKNIFAIHAPLEHLPSRCSFDGRVGLVALDLDSDRPHARGPPPVIGSEQKALGAIDLKF
jgi:hypothetical protein